MVVQSHSAQYSQFVNLEVTFFDLFAILEMLSMWVVLPKTGVSHVFL